MVAEAAARPARRFTDVRGRGTVSAAVRISGASPRGCGLC